MVIHFFSFFSASHFTTLFLFFSRLLSGALRTILAGGLGGVALWIPSYPIDLVKSRIQVLHTGRGAAPNFVSVAIDIVKKEGPLALYRYDWLT